MSALQSEADVPADCKVVERLHYVLCEVDDVRLHEMELQLAVIHLPHVQELVYQTKDSETVSVHQIVQVLLLRIGFLLTHLLQRTHYKGKRGTYLVGYVREHLQFHLLDLRLRFLRLQRQFPVSVLDEDQCDDGAYTYICYPCPE